MTEAPSATRRRVHLDWLRGIAVLLMIEAHLFDSWIGHPDRATRPFGYAMIVGGMGTALFLFLAGVAVGLSAGSKLRRTGSRRFATAAVARRGLEIFGLAFLFRFQAWVLGGSTNPRDLLRVDILNIMGPAIAATALLWTAMKSVRGRSTLFAVAALVVVLTAPYIRGFPFSGVPDPIRAYIVPVQGLSNFVFIPWIGLVFAGACLGVLTDAASTPPSERRLAASLALVGTVLSVGAYAAASLPPLDARSSFWTTSVSYFLMRVGVMTAATAIAYWWTTRAAGREAWSPMVHLGRSSLFIYWVHVELVYGIVSRPLQHNLTLGRAAIAYVLFVALMLGCATLKERVALRWAPR
jgi:uncharacterized membrane protein